MGSDIFTESAVAVELETFLNVDAINKKGARELIANILYQEKIIGDESLSAMTKDKDDFIETFISEISMSDGYENCQERNKFMLETFGLHTGIDMSDMPEWSLRQFDNCRESGYDIMTDVMYIMFESYDLFETVMTDEGKKVAKKIQNVWDENYSNKIDYVVGPGWVYGGWYAGNLSYHLYDRPKLRYKLNENFQNKGIIRVSVLGDIKFCKGILLRIEPYYDSCLMGKK